jgi:hypothetical protein
MSKTVCDFGCGRDATKQLKNGRFVCAEFVAQCPAMSEERGAKTWQEPVRALRVESDPEGWQSGRLQCS